MKSLPNYQTTISKSREYQSLHKVFRAGLHLDAGAYASYGLNPTPTPQLIIIIIIIIII